MADKELKKLKRRELLQMLLIQCEESERLQGELDEITTEHEAMSESYERLKVKLSVKDDRLNQKDAKIAELKKEIEEIKSSRTTEFAETDSISEAIDRLNEIFETAQQAVDQYLANIRKLSEMDQRDKKENRIPFEISRRTGVRRGTSVPRVRQTLKAASGDARG